MGVVYLASDTELERQVALKWLRPGFASEPERVARFRREAKLMARFSHPNIAVIHDWREQEGHLFLVLEYIKGGSLAELIKEGPMRTDQALEICRQSGAALQVAHAKRIVHRDLKPANVMITADHQVKVLDFGLARPTQFDEASSAAGSSYTQTGQVLGTLPYMSPEQVQGKKVDHRTDIWAFGCILFECLSGQRAFRGTSLDELLRDIRFADVDWASMAASVPGTIRELGRRCLHKEPENRISSIEEGFH